MKTEITDSLSEDLRLLDEIIKSIRKRIKQRENCRLWYHNNSDKKKEQNRLWQRNHPEKVKKNAHLWSKKHPTKIKESNRLWKENNPEKVNAIMRIYRKNKRRTNLAFKLMCNLRGRLYNALSHNLKSASTIELLGCEVSFLKQHLESKFKPGMTWENHGVHGWHIDHIRPCASFDLSKPDEQQKCFHYTNLQPLWAEDNRNKSDKLPT